MIKKIIRFLFHRKIKVKKFISYSDAIKLKEAPCGGLGGFFDHGMRWKDYADCFSKEPEAAPYFNAIRDYCLKHGIQHTGESHQHRPNGVPLFNDGTIATYSFRAWGDLMAAIWSEAEDKDYCYMDFYM